MIAPNKKRGGLDFLDGKLKAVMFAGIWYLNRRLKQFGAHKVYGEQEQHIVTAATLSANKNWKHPLQRWLCKAFAGIIAGICAVDNAYASFFAQFIDEYNNLRGTHYGKPTPMPPLPQEIPNKRDISQTFRNEAREAFRATTKTKGGTFSR